MIGQWARRRWLVPNLIDVAFTSTGATSYTVGTNQNFNTPRTDRLEFAYARLLPIVGSSPVDFPLTIIEAHEDYSRITLKQLSSFPTVIFYDSGFPNASVYPYPVPPAGMYEIHIGVKNILTEFASLTTEITLPLEYIDALIWSLAVRIRPLFGMQNDPTLVALSSTALNTIRGANSQVPRLSMPAGMPGTSGGRWMGHGIPNYGTVS